MRSSNLRPGAGRDEKGGDNKQSGFLHNESLKRIADRRRGSIVGFLGPCRGLTDVRVADAQLEEQVDPAAAEPLDVRRLAPGEMAQAAGLRLELARRAWLRLGRDVVGQLGAHPIVVTRERDEGYNGNGVAGVQFAEVEVDTETGLVRVTKLVAVHDVGKVINPDVVRGQCVGGMIQGLGTAICEGYIYDQQGGFHNLLFFEDL